MKMRSKVFCVLAVLMTLCTLNGFATTVEAASPAKPNTPPVVGQGRGPRQDAPHHLRDAHAQYHNGKACPNPQICDFFKKNPKGPKTPGGNGASVKLRTPRAGQGRGPRQNAPHHLHDDHAQFHHGQACPNPRTCAFFQK